MGQINAAAGQAVSDGMIETWAEALDRDEWPEGWVNVGGIVDGAPPARRGRTVTLTVRVPPAVKTALEARAREAGETVSATARGLLEEALVTSGS